MFDPAASEEAWDAALRAAAPGAAALRAAPYFRQAASQCHELFVGGNDSPLLLQLLAAPEKEGSEELDLLASVLAPEEEGTRLCCSQRGADAAKLLACFLEAFPEAPALLQRGGDAAARAGAFDYVLCGVPEEPWTKGPTTLRRLGALCALPQRDRLAFFLPAEPQAVPARDRPALRR